MTEVLYGTPKDAINYPQFPQLKMIAVDMLTGNKGNAQDIQNKIEAFRNTLTLSGVKKVYLFSSTFEGKEVSGVTFVKGDGTSIRYILSGEGGLKEEINPAHLIHDKRYEATRIQEYIIEREKVGEKKGASLSPPVELEKSATKQTAKREKEALVVMGRGQYPSRGRGSVVRKFRIPHASYEYAEEYVAEVEKGLRDALHYLGIRASEEEMRRLLWVLLSLSGPESNHGTNKGRVCRGCFQFHPDTARNLMRRYASYFGRMSVRSAVETPRTAAFLAVVNMYACARNGEFSLKKGRVNQWEVVTIGTFHRFHEEAFGKAPVAVSFRNGELKVIYSK